MFYFLLFIGFAFSLQTVEKPAKEGTIEITIKGLRNHDGVIVANIFSSSHGFPGDAKKSLKIKKVPADGNDVTIIFEKLPYGQYAVAVMHDEDDDGKLNTNMLGIPKEGYGVSNNKIPKFKKPQFEDAAFELAETEKSLVINMYYF